MNVFEHNIKEIAYVYKNVSFPNHMYLTVTHTLLFIISTSKISSIICDNNFPLKTLQFVSKETRSLSTRHTQIPPFAVNNKSDKEVKYLTGRLTKTVTGRLIANSYLFRSNILHIINVFNKVLRTQRHRKRAFNAFYPYILLWIACFL